MINMETCDLLVQLGYNLPSDCATSLECLQNAGISDRDYRELVRWLACAIKQYTPGIDETVSSVDDLHSFAMEISSFLKELGCPYHRLLEGPISARYRSEDDSTLLVDFLTGECMTGVIIQQRQNEEKKYQSNLSQIIDTPLNTIMQLCRSLSVDVNCNETEICVTDVFDQMIDRMESTSQPVPELLFRPNVKLSDDQWTHLNQCHTDLQEEYNLRRKLMMTRLDVTMIGFQWKGATKLDVAQIWRHRKRYLSSLVTRLNQMDISYLLVADRNLLIVEKVVSTRIQGSKNNVFQGNLKLPHRGGTVSIDQKPHMPLWSSREEGQPCENLRKKQPKKAKPNDDNNHQKTDKKSKKKHRKDNGDIE